MSHTGTTSPFELVQALLRRVGDDPASRDRIALASTFSHGESAWVAETAWQAAHAGHHVNREATVGGTTRVDLQIDEIAIEFKATFGAWAITEGTEDERDTWLGRDIDKLANTTAPALVIVTVAALTEGIRHQRQRFQVTHDPSNPNAPTPADVLQAGIAAVQRTLERRCPRTATIALPNGHLPPHHQGILLAAVVGATNQKALQPRTA